MGTNRRAFVSLSKGAEMTKQDTIFETSVKLAAAVRQLAEKCTLTVPDDTADLIAAILTASKTRVRFLSKPRKGSSDRVRAFHKMFQWHAGLCSNSLWGPMLHCHVDGFDDIDTAANMLAIIYTGKFSSAATAWNHALTGK